MRRTFFQRAIALGLAEVIAITSMLWAAPPQPRLVGPPPNPEPFVPTDPPLVKLARAYEEMLEAAASIEGLEPAPSSEPIIFQEPPPPPPAPLPRLVAAFAFGNDAFTRPVPNEPSATYTKVIQDSPNFQYDASRGYGYTDLDGLDGSPNNRNVLDGLDEIYDQFIGAKPGSSDIVFRADVPNGTYRFVAAGGDAKYGNHKTTVHARDGRTGSLVTLVEDFLNPNCEFWRTAFDGKLPPEGDGSGSQPLFAPLQESPTLTVTNGYVEIHQIAGEGFAAGGDLNLLELWLIDEQPPPEPPDDLVAAFAFGADEFTIDSPNAPGVPYTKIVQDGLNFLYTTGQGFGYSDITGLDTSLNNRGILSGDAEIYDQFIGAKPGGSSIVFRVDVPNGLYRLVAAGGDAKYTNHVTSIEVRDGADGAVDVFVDMLRNPKNEFYQIGFDDKRPPIFSGVNFLPLSTSPVIQVTNGFLEIRQIAGEQAAAGGDLSILEIWKVEPAVLPGDFVSAFAFGADHFTRESPNAPVAYTKVVQDGLNFEYDPARGYGYTDLSGLDKSPNNRNILDGEDEIYDQFIGAKPGGKKIVFRVDVPNGEYRFVASGGDIRYENHKSSILVRDGSTGAFLPFVEDLENENLEFFRVGFRDKHAPGASRVNFLPEVASPKLEVTQGYLELHQLAVIPSAGGGDLSLLEVWRAVVPPTVAIELPLESAFLSSPSVPVRVTYTDPEDVQIIVDGVDRTAELSVGATLAEGSLVVADGLHDLEALVSNAAGSARATAMFVVDTSPPEIEITSPANDSFSDISPITLNGTVRDRDPATTVDCPGASLDLVGTSTAGIREWSFSCSVSLTEGGNLIVVTATDSGGRQASAERGITLDTVSPQVSILEPTPDTFTMADVVDVSGAVLDDSPVTVRVEGASPVDAGVEGASFSAIGVPLGTPTSGAGVLLRVIAEDAAGNIGEASVSVIFDVSPPLVTLSSPVANSIIPSPVTVTGNVTDPAPVVLVDVNGQAVMVEGNSFTTTLTALDGSLLIEARAQDAAGNEGIAQTTVTVDSTPPVVAVSAPVNGLITSQAPVGVAGTVTDVTDVTLTVNGTPILVENGSFAADVDVTEGSQNLDFVATDAAGNVGAETVGVVIDTVAPALEILSPGTGEILLDLPVMVQGSVTDATAVAVEVNGVVADRMADIWHATFDTLPELDNTFTVVATDAAGNRTSRSVDTFLDLSPPVLTITDPPGGFLTNADSVVVGGTVTDASTVSVSVNGVSADVVAGSFSATVPLVDGDNSIQVVATDAAGRNAQEIRVVTQDAIPPTLDLTTPDAVSGITSGQVIATATDNLALAELTLRVNGAVQATSSGEAISLELGVPDGFAPGDTVVVRLDGFDTAGNAATASRGVIVIEDGVIVGQVLSDLTSLPIEGASVTLGSRVVATGAQGQYSLPTGDADVVLLVEKDGATSVERRLSVISDVGTVPVDARLTPLAPEELVGIGGASLTSSSVEVTIPPLPAEQSFTLTPLSAQGLPALLPLGWSPLIAFDIRGTLPAPATVRAMAISDEAVTVHVAQYRASLHEWVMLEPSLTPSGGEVSFAIPESGAYAVLAADGDIVVPAADSMLEGLEMKELSTVVTTNTVVDPPILPPSGGIATGAVTVISPAEIPSGTVIQAEITETFTLASGETASEETRLEDILLFQNPRLEPDADVSAQFPIASSLAEREGFDVGEVVSGIVNLDLLAGRESVRGDRGGSRAVSIQENGVQLSVPSGALADDTAIDVQTFEGVSDFVPADTSLDPLEEVFIDLSGQTLGLGAEISIDGMGLSPDDSYVLAKVVRIDGVPRLEFVAEAELAADRVTAPGLTRQGRYVFYRVPSPVGFVSGTTTPPRAFVETSGLPFVAISDATGSYNALALTGPTTVTAFVPRTSLRAIGNADVIEGETTNLDLNLAGEITLATVSPSDGALGVEVSAQLNIATTAALDEASITPDNLRLFRGDPVDNVLVPTRLVLSGSGRSLAIIPEANLDFETIYTLDAVALGDIFGGAVSIPQVRFTTASDQALQVDASAIFFSLPDDNGIVQISNLQPLPPGTTVLIVNAGNGFVLSLTVDNDGNLAGDLPATISDRILVTLTDPAGTMVSFEKSKFVAPDGTTGIGAGGGTVDGPDGLELRIPEGALKRGVTLKLESMDESEFPVDERPEIPGANFGAGLKITSEDMPTYDREVEIAFPKPVGAPDDAFYYVVRKLTTETGEVYWETIDQAFVDGEKVVTSSPPFRAYIDSLGSLQGLGVTGALVGSFLETVFLLMWSAELTRPAQATNGVVTGKIQQTVFEPGATAPRLRALEDIPVFTINSAGERSRMLAVSQKDGTYTIYDETYKSGNVFVEADHDGLTRGATAFRIAAGGVTNPLRWYVNVATANITFPAPAPPLNPPVIDIVIQRKKSDGTLERTDGLVVADDELIIGFVTTDTVQRATINDEVFSVRRDSSDETVDWVMEQDFVPGRPGTFLVKVTAIATDGGVIEEAVTFRAIAPGGSNDDILVDDPPSVITLKTIPKNDATGVSVDIFPRVTFTEPVTNIPGNVSLTDGSGAEVGIVISGVQVGGAPIAVIDNAAVEVTSLTIQPMTGLRFGERYTLRLGTAIVDLDPTPKNLVEFTTSFETFGPTSLSNADDKFGSTGVAVLEDRAYLVENHFFNGTIRVYEITDPTMPAELPGASNTVNGRPVDVAAADGKLVVATGPTNRSRPSNLYIFDASQDDETLWIGAASVAASAVDGFVKRVELLDGFAYVLTGRKGVQVVDLDQAAQLFTAAGGTGPVDSFDFLQITRRLNTDGQGFGQQAVASSVDLRKTGTTLEWSQQALAVSRVASSVWVGVTGEAPLILVNPVTQEKAHPAAIEHVTGLPDNPVVEGALTTGAAIAMGLVGGREVALIAGWGTVDGEPPGHVLAVVDVQTPSVPRVLGIIALPIDDTPTDVILTDTRAIITGRNEAAIVNITNPEQPVFAGTISMVGGALALTDTNILVSSERSTFGGDTEHGGVNTAVLDFVAIVEKTTPRRIVVGAGPVAVEDFDLTYRVVPVGYDIQSSELQYVVGSNIVGTVPAPLDETDRGTIPLARGFEFPRLSSELASPRLVINAGTPTELASGARSWDLSPFTATISAPHFNEAESDDDAFIPLRAQGLNGHVADVLGFNDALNERSEDGMAAPGGFTVRWKGVGDVVDIVPDLQNSDRGVYEAFLEGVPVPGTMQQAVLTTTDNIVLAESNVLNMLPGPATSVVLKIPDGKTELPADGVSRFQFTLEARDVAGNLVENGTPVYIRVEGDGEILSQEFSTTDGTVNATYRAGTKFGADRIIGLVDGVEGVAEIFLFELTAELTVDKSLVTIFEDVTATVKVTSAVGPPANGTPVAWLALASSTGSLSIDRFTTGGEAKARMRFRHFGTRDINVFVRGAHDRAVVTVASEQDVLAINQRFSMIAGDRTEDGIVSVQRWDGSTDELMVPAQSLFTISGGEPGEVITLSMGTLDAPNLLPEAKYLMDEINAGTAPEFFGRHPGTISGDIEVSDDSPFEDDDRASYRFSTSGRITIPANGPFVQSVGLSTSFWVKPGAGSDGGVVLERDGNFELAVIQDGANFRVRLTGWLGGSPMTLESSQLIQADAWAQVHAGFLSGVMELEVDGVRESQPLLAVDGGTGDLVVGDAFEGNLSDLRFYHTSGSSPPMLLFENGQQTMEITLDADGSADFYAKSSGQMTVLPDDPYVGDPALRDTALQEWGRESALVKFRMEREAALPPIPEQTIAVLPQILLITILRITEALLFGSSGETDIDILLFDVALGFVPLAPLQLFVTIRDLTFAIERVMNGSANIFDALTILISVVTLVATGGAAARAGKFRRLLNGLHALRNHGQALLRAARWTNRAVGDPATLVRMENTFDLLTKHGDEVALATGEVLEVAENGWQHLDELEGAVKFSEDATETVQRLAGVKEAGGLNRLRRVVTTLAGCALKLATPPQVASASLLVPLLLLQGGGADDCEELSGISEAVIILAADDGALDESKLITLIDVLDDDANEVLEDLFDAVKHGKGGNATRNLLEVLNQLASNPGPNNQTSRAARAVIAFALQESKRLGQKVEAFEEVVVIVKKGGGTVSREYDIVFKGKNAQFLLEIEVKADRAFSASSTIWKSGSKRAQEMQRDLVRQWKRGKYQNSKWAFSSKVANRKEAIKKWVLEQFESDYVKSQMTREERRQAIKDLEKVFDDFVVFFDFVDPLD